MTRAEFLQFVRSLLGRMPALGAREPLQNLIRNGDYEFRFLWEWVPKGEIGSNPKNPLKRIDGVKLELGFCNTDSFTVYVPEESRK